MRTVSVTRLRKSANLAGPPIYESCALVLVSLHDGGILLQRKRWILVWRKGKVLASSYEHMEREEDTRL